mmetsp:Transcript_4519/g.12652  ORF Transcript_4519/g.12652 Transcript_4519/m.12652 type:complete len:504 (-) Transcript_4519:260-1771(-)
MLESVLGRLTDPVTWVFVVFLLFVWVMVKYYYRVYHYRVYRKGALLPSPCYPLVYHLPLVLSEFDQLYHLIQRLHTQYGESFALLALRDYQTVVQMKPSYDNIKWVLKDNFSNYILPLRRQEVLKEVLGDGIFAVNGNEWRSQRKTASHIFTGNNLKRHMAYVFVIHAEKVVERIEASARAGTALDIQTLFFEYTMATFAEIGLGEELRTLDGENKEFFDVFDLAQHLSIQRFRNPFWKIFRTLGIGDEPRLAEAVRKMDSYALKIVRKRLNSDDVDERMDLISFFLENARRNGHAMTEKELRDIVINFLVAGRDTTACLLTWMMYEFHLNPKVEATVLEEILRLTENGTLGLTSDVLKEMTYTEACALETLRLHPSVPLDDREALEDDFLPDGTFIAKGHSVSFAPYAVGRCEELWGEDVLEFRPERWLEGKKPDQYMFPSFSAGPRICLGRALSLLEAKVAVGTFLPKFRFDLINETVEYKVGVTMSVKDGLWMKPHARES